MYGTCCWSDAFLTVTPTAQQTDLFVREICVVLEAWQGLSRLNFSRELDERATVGVASRQHQDQANLFRYVTYELPNRTDITTAYESSS